MKKLAQRPVKKNQTYTACCSLYRMYRLKRMLLLMMIFKDDAIARVRVCIPLVFMRILFALFLSLSLSLSLFRFYAFLSYFYLKSLLSSSSSSS